MTSQPLKQPLPPLQVRSLAGELLATVPDLHTESLVADVLDRLPSVLPGHRYALMRGKEELDIAAALGSEPAELCAVVVKKQGWEQSLGMALIDAAQALDTKQVQVLLEAGANASFVDDPPGTWGAKNKRSPLHMALDSSTRRQNKEQYKSVVEALVAARADVNATRVESDWRGCGSTKTAFEMALPLAMQDSALLKLFMDAGGDPNMRSVRNVHSMRTDGREQHHVLHMAVKPGNLEVVRTLLDAGAKVDAVESEHFDNERGYNRHMEQTALHIACHNKDVATVALLLERSADVNRVRKDLEQIKVEGSEEDDPRSPGFMPDVECLHVEETALHIAIACKCARLVSFLVCAGADTTRERLRGGERTSPEELCGGDADMLGALKAEWSPEVQQLFSEEELAGAQAVVSKLQNRG